MTKNCLKTVLLSKVNNPDLVTPETLRIKIPAGRLCGRYLWKGLNTTCNITLVSGSVVEDVTFPYTISATSGAEFQVTGGENGAVLDINNKYKLVACDLLTTAQETKVFDLSVGNIEQINQLVGGMTGPMLTSGDLLDIADGCKWKRVAFYRSPITGDIKYLSRCHSLSLFSFNYAPCYLIGSLEELVSYIRRYKETGSITLAGFEKTLVTFNGNSINSGTNMGNKTLSWTASTITFDGTEISNSTVADSDI